MQDYYIPLTLKYFKSSESIQKNLFGNTTYSINIPTDIDELSENQEFKNAIVILTNQRETIEYFFNRTISTFEKVIKTIDLEINKKE